MSYRGFLVYFKKTNDFFITLYYSFINIKLFNQFVLSTSHCVIPCWVNVHTFVYGFFHRLRTPAHSGVSNMYFEWSSNNFWDDMAIKVQVPFQAPFVIKSTRRTFWCTIKFCANTFFFFFQHSTYNISKSNFGFVLKNYFDFCSFLIHLMFI